jgi:hypothetical protein
VSSRSQPSPQRTLTRMTAVDVDDGTESMVLSSVARMLRMPMTDDDGSEQGGADPLNLCRLPSVCKESRG